MNETVASDKDATQPQTEKQDRDSKPDPVSVDAPKEDATGTGPIRGPATDWDAFFREKTRDPLDVRKLVFQLHAAREHSEVIAVIRAALRQNQAQPWMYEVLALSLKIAGAPQPEIERALLSHIDFAATDAPSLMLSAAYLTRFGAKEPALRLYRQASDLAPQRPESYLLGLDLARELQNDEALAWAVRGIFASAWGDHHQRQHQQAENAVIDRARELRAAGEEDSAARLEQMLAKARRVDLDVRLEWSGAGDLDLFVQEPNGAICSFKNRRTRGGGVLVHDGYGPHQENCYEHYVCAAGFPGVYRVTVRHVRGEIVGKRAKLIIVQHKGAPHESRRTIIVPVTDEGETVRVALMGGRREELLTIPEETEPAKKTTSSRRQPRDAAERVAAARFRDSIHAQVGGGVPIGANPIAGVGAVGYQPLVRVIPSGAMLGARAVVSPDRRYVRLSLSPQFTELIDIFQFQFNRGN